MTKQPYITTINKTLSELVERLMQAGNPAEIAMENSRAAGVVMVAEAMGKMAMLEIGVSSHKNALLSTFVPQAIDAPEVFKQIDQSEIPKPDFKEEFFKHEKTHTF